MAEHWFKQYRRGMITARASWKTSPAHRKAVLDKAYRMAILAYGWSTFFEVVE